ncbi:biogenesis of lysosome-related organelles complex 1 subunit 6 isoform X1 [Anoplopoma fimbria]|uniref:biogenesis of lysosome-related organelles complex 1 subunit 6 isoform X1 n=2 Tax=Anoplopoma fimbria TaxID=229290 RepID=UPI0023EBC276|nr:biogenesis of lysosome-related organelles complex 1 subunit 6 isoform X1 [Anoplopoma fimbria]
MTFLRTQQLNPKKKRRERSSFLLLPRLVTPTNIHRQTGCKKGRVWFIERSLHMEGEEMQDDEGPSLQSEPPHNEDLQLAQQESLRLESSVPVEDVFVDKKAVDKLTEGLLSHYLPDLQNSKRALQELTQNQLILLDTLDQEVTKFRDCNTLLDLNSLFTEAKVYHNKLVNIRKEMIMLHEKTTKLKKRALKLQQQKQKEALEKEQQREKELERERQLVAKPARRT